MVLLACYVIFVCLSLTETHSKSTWCSGALTASVCSMKAAARAYGKLVFPGIPVALCTRGITTSRRSSPVLPHRKKTNVHKHGDITDEQDAVLSPLLVISISPRSCWNKFVEPSRSPCTALHAHSKQRLFHYRRKWGFTRRRWRWSRRRGSDGASGRSEYRWRRVALRRLPAASKSTEHGWIDHAKGVREGNVMRHGHTAPFTPRLISTAKGVFKKLRKRHCFLIHIVSCSCTSCWSNVSPDCVHCCVGRKGTKCPV